MCCGSCVGCAAFASNFVFLNSGFEFNIQVVDIGINAFLQSEFVRLFTLVYYVFTFQSAYYVLYPIELAFMSIAKLFVLDRMMTFAKFKQSPALQQRISVASRLVVVLVVCINVVSIAGGIVTAVKIQPIINIITVAIADYNKNPNMFTGLKIILEDLPKSQPYIQDYLLISNVQLICEVVLLALLIAVFVLTGIVCIRRILALAISPTDTDLKHNRRVILRQISSTVLVIFVSFLLRITYAILQASARFWISTNLTQMDLQALILPNPLKPPASLDINCVALFEFLIRHPEFQNSVIMLSSPVTLLVALWGMTTLQARKLLFPFLYSADEISELSTPLSMRKS